MPPLPGICGAASIAEEEGRKASEFSAGICANFALMLEIINKQK